VCEKRLTSPGGTRAGLMAPPQQLVVLSVLTAFAGTDGQAPPCVVGTRGCAEGIIYCGEEVEVSFYTSTTEPPGCNMHGSNNPRMRAWQALSQYCPGNLGGNSDDAGGILLNGGNGVTRAACRQALCEDGLYPSCNTYLQAYATAYAQCNTAGNFLLSSFMATAMSDACQATCGDLPAVFNGAWYPPQGGLHEGDSKTLRCQTGNIETPAGATVTCTGGQWRGNGTGAQCSPPSHTVMCGRPRHITGGAWSAGASFISGDTASLSCGDGYTETPSGATATCGQDGQWHEVGAPAQCVAHLTCSAAGLPPVTNGHWAPAPPGGFQVGTHVHLTCATDFIETPANYYVVCNSNGMITGPPPGATCVGHAPPPTQCNAPNQLSNGGWSSSSTSANAGNPAGGGGYAINQKAYLHCDPGYTHGLRYQQCQRVGSSLQMVSNPLGFSPTCVPQPPPTQCSTCTTFGEYQSCYRIVTNACCSIANPLPGCSSSGIPSDCPKTNTACVTALRSTHTTCDAWLRSTSAMAAAHTRLTDVAASCAPTCTSFSEFQYNAAIVTAECCDEPEEDCTAGYPSMCNSGCASVLLPVHDACDPWLRTMPSLLVLQNALDSVAELCTSSSGGGGSGGGH
jgi:hypothetical protein